MKCRWESLGLDESREQKRWKRRGRCMPSQLFRSLFVCVPLWSLSCLSLCCSIAPSPSFRFSFFLHRNHGFAPSPWLQNSFCKSRHDPELTNILKFSSLLSELPKVLAFWCVLVCGCVWRRRCYLYRALLSLGAASLGSVLSILARPLRYIWSAFHFQNLVFF